MSFSIGIVGLPNVGKSTLFKALTKKQVDAANYPFCTIDPNVGVVAVPDERLDKLAATCNSEKVIPTTIEFVDIAGLVKGAHKGEGLGNQFLSNIREVDAIAHVVRGFTDKNVIHVAGQVDPNSDQETINLELIFADLQTVEKRHEKLTKLARGNDKDALKILPIIERVKQALEDGKPVRTLSFTADEALLIKDLNLLTQKPILLVMNVDENSVIEETDFIAISAKIEAELSELPAEEAKVYMQELGMRMSGLDKLIQAAYKTLNLITYFTAGPKEAHAWTITNGTKAPQAAGVIHSDFEKGFIRAEVINWHDFVTCNGEVGAREKGLLRIEGKEYIFQDGDVAHFRFNP